VVEKGWPMITFRPMQAQEFAAYRAYFVPDYARDLVENRGLTLVEASQKAAADLDAAFPDGPQTDAGQTSRQSMLCILRPKSQVIGYLWYEPQSDGEVAFIQDFHILPAFQGLGLAKATIFAFEASAKTEGFKQIRLRVAPENVVALHVYTESGFRIGGIQMVKSLWPG
jgi:ribosomal protein S18 acetylase RimI-like enzyme